jgi:hypothetical protein
VQPQLAKQPGGLAGRANLLVRDGRMLLIDVAFVEARPTPWRQAVDLANMMLCLALRSDAERVYQRALRQFRVDEISEGFAAARGLALPSQLRRMLRAQGRDLHGESVKLLPAPPRRIPVQRWSARRVGLGAAIVLLLVLVTQNPTLIFDNRMAVRTSLGIHSLDCSQLEPQWLMSQSVPSTSLVPCVRTQVPGWTVADVAVNNGRSVITLDHDRAGKGAVVVRLAAGCDTTGTVQTPSPQPGVLRYQRIDHSTDVFGAIWYDRFPGCCVTYRLHSTSDVEGSFAIELPGLLGFTNRDTLARRSSSAPTGDCTWTPAKHDGLASLTDRCLLCWASLTARTARAGRWREAVTCRGDAAACLVSRSAAGRDRPGPLRWPAAGSRCGRRVQHTRNVDPGVVGSEAGRPDHDVHLAAVGEAHRAPSPPSAAAGT